MIINSAFPSADSWALASHLAVTSPCTVHGEGCRNPHPTALLGTPNRTIREVQECGKTQGTPEEFKL